MAFKSEAHRRKAAELVRRGKLSQATYDAWNDATGDKKLPEKVKPKAKPFKVGKVKVIK